jgi:hypothetical protein
MNSAKINKLYEDSRDIKNTANRWAVQAIINSGEVNAADTINDDKDRTEADYEWLAIATIESCLASGEHNHHVVGFFTRRGITY